MKNINIAEILKYCPKGIQLYSPICGKCTFDSLNKGTIICITQNDQKITFTSEGYYMLPVFEDSECVLFPSKENRDWNAIRYFKDADIVAATIPHTGIWVGIFKQYTNNKFESYCFVSAKGVFNNIGHKDHSLVGTRFASEEEQQKLFQVIKDNGYHWNAETKTLEKLIKPKFKVGDKIKKLGYKFTIIQVKDNNYLTKCGNKIPIDNQDDFILVPNKFDIDTLKAFESRVLVREYDNRMWMPTFFGMRLEDDSNCSYITTNGCYKYCIPYKGNEWLLGTTNDCDDFYKTW